MASRLFRRRTAAAPFAPSVLRACRAAGLSALVLAGAAAAGAAPASAAMFGYGMSAPDVADMLYARYRVARVMRVVPTGDVFQADAIDRRGFRIHFTIDGYTGEVLESFVMGRVAYEPAVPVPPGLVPGVRDFPPSPDDDLMRPEPRRAPPPAQRGRQARNPDPAAPAPAPKVKQVPAPKPPVAAPAAPAPATASRQPAEKALEPATQPPATVTPPAQAVRPVAPAPQATDEPKAPEVKQAGPPARLPEPLIDPKTGQANGSVPVAPLDAGPTENKAPITIVPPAPLE